MSDMVHANERIAAATEALVNKMGGGTTPAVSGDDNGKVLTVVEGEWSAAAIPSQLPAVTGDDVGKVLMVDAEGNWVAVLPE